jgi:PAS domain S-box-containing protein
MIDRKQAGLLHIESVQQQIMDDAMLIMNADFASLQMYIPETMDLKLLASKNFHKESEKFWHLVRADSPGISSITLRNSKRQIIPDLFAEENVINLENKKQYKLSGIKSRQSIRLLARDGRFIGVLSTFWKNVHIPSEKDLQLFDILSRQAADFIERQELENTLQQMVEARTVELKNAYSDLKKSKEHFTLLFEVSPVAKSIARISDGIIINVNPAWEKMFELKKENVIGKSAIQLGVLTVVEDNIQDNLLHGVKDKIEGNELKFSMPHGKELFAFVSGAPLIIEGVEYFLTAYFDITARKQAEQQIAYTAHQLKEKNIELERTNEELESFNYIASHDLQEPLRKIETFLKLLQKNRNDEEMANKYINKTIDSTKNMSMLIQSVLNYSRISKTKLHEFSKTDLNKVLNEVKSSFELQIQEKQAHIISDKLPVVIADPIHMQQLFSNLISNSLKFSTETPVIKITSRIVNSPDLPQIKHREDSKPVNGKKFAEIKIADNGIGFETQYAKKIFDLFQRLHGRSEYAGTGVGLSISKKIVEHHNGFITASSQPGKGAVFTVWIPA